MERKRKKKKIRRKYELEFGCFGKDLTNRLNRVGFSICYRLCDLMVLVVATKMPRTRPKNSQCEKSVNENTHTFTESDSNGREKFVERKKNTLATPNLLIYTQIKRKED